MRRIDRAVHLWNQCSFRRAFWFRASIACVLILALLVPQPAAVACGPFFTETIFSFRLHPDFPLTRFAAGDLGIVQPTYARSYLVVAYRYMSGKTLNKTEQESVVGLWSRRFAHSFFADEAHPDPASEWLKVRRKYTKGKDAQYIEQYRQKWGRTDAVENYFYFQNCTADAFHTAVQTLNRRATTFGPESSNLKSWIAAQDLVFSHCGNPSEEAGAKLPDPLPPSATSLLRADREYQIAAIHFYSGDFATSEKDFDAIAEDRNSPWHVTAALLSARSRIRRATLLDSDAQADADLRAAEEKLHSILKDAHYRAVHPVAERLLGFIAYRLRPEQRYAELATQLTSRDHIVNLGDAIGDYTLLLDKRLGDTDDVEAEQRQKLLDRGFAKLRKDRQRSDLTDWIATFQSTGPTAEGHAVTRWKETKSLPWLFAALTKTSGSSPDVQALIKASAEVGATEPAYLGIAFHRCRLQAEAGHADKARVGVDELLGLAANPLPRSAINLVLALRMTLAENLDEWLKYSLRVPTLVTTDESAEETPSDFYLWDLSAKSADTLRREKRSKEVQFDFDAASTLTEAVPLATLASAAQNEVLPEPLRRNVAQAAWVKAFLLNRRDLALQLVPTMKDFFPQRTPELDAYVAAASEDQQRFAGAFSILKSPGWHPYVEQGAGRETTDFAKIDNYKNNWWCSWQKPKNEEWTEYNYYRAQGLSAPLGILYPDGFVETPAFLGKDSRDQAAKEWQQIEATGTSIEALAEPVLTWAKSHSDDARVPEALHYVVRAYRYGCDEPSRNFSKIAFKILHDRYPKSEWTKNTPLWF